MAHSNVITPSFLFVLFEISFLIGYGEFILKFTLNALCAEITEYTPYCQSSLMVVSYGLLS